MRYISRIFDIFICYTDFVNFNENRRNTMTLLEATRKRIDDLCNANNMNINQLAIASGINPSTIRSIFKVIKKAPSSDTIHYICIGFGISIKDFYDSKLFDDLDDND